MMYKGWITAQRYQQKDLEKLGIKVGRYNRTDGSFDNCEVSDAAMSKLEKLWGVYYWGLTRIGDG